METTTSTPNTSKVRNDIDLLDTVISLWKDKVIILISIALCISFGLAVHNYQSKKPAQYILYAQLTSTPDMSTSIQLTKIWTSAFSAHTELSFSSPLTKRYADQEFPYSPLSLLIRFSEFINAESTKSKFNTQHELPEDIRKSLLSSKINYPVNIKKEVLTELTLISRVTPAKERSIKEFDQNLKMYTNWARIEFNSIIEREIDSLIPGSHTKIDDYLFEVQHSFKKITPRAKLPLIIFISFIGGLASGICISLFKSSIKKRLENI